MPDSTSSAGERPSEHVRPVFGGGRTEARERAVLLSYEAEQRSIGASEIVAEQPLGVDAFTRDALVGIESARAAIDERIDRHSTSWRIERLPAIDRAILRQGVWELTDRPEVPVAVTINEAVELAHDYSTDDSGGFVNGVLSAVAREVRGHG